MICKYCHKFKNRSFIKKHQKNCMPSQDDIESYNISKTGGKKEYKQEQENRKHDNKA